MQFIHRSKLVKGLLPDDICVRRDRLDEYRKQLSEFALRPQPYVRFVSIGAGLTVVLELLIARAKQRVIISLDRLDASLFETHEMEAAIASFLDPAHSDRRIYILSRGPMEAPHGSVLERLRTHGRVGFLLQESPKRRTASTGQFVVIDDGEAYWDKSCDEDAGSFSIGKTDSSSFLLHEFEKLSAQRQAA